MIKKKKVMICGDNVFSQYSYGGVSILYNIITPFY